MVIRGMNYADTVTMTLEELQRHPEVEMCSCAHPCGLHKYGAECSGTYAEQKPCDCVGFASTGLRLKNSLISLPDRAPGISDLMASIVERHTGTVSRRALVEDLTALVNAEREWCAKVAMSACRRGDNRICTSCSEEIGRTIRSSQ